MLRLEDLKKILILVPHPDDEVLGCGGLILKLKQLNASIHLILFTKGEALETLKEKNLPKDIRINEFKESMKRFGISSYDILNFPDGKVENYEDEIRKVIEDAINSFNPDCVILPSIFDPHKDHSTIGKVGYEIYKNKPYIPFLMYFVHSFLKANFLVDISNVISDLLKIFDVYSISLKNDIETHKEIYIGIRKFYALPKKGFMEPYILLNKFNSYNDLIRFILSKAACSDFKSEVLEKIDKYYRFIEFVNSLNNKNKELSLKLKELTLELKIKEEYIKELNREKELLLEELAYIKRSIFYKFMIKYRKMIDNMLPEGTLRRDIYSKITKVIKTWIS